MKRYSLARSSFSRWLLALPLQVLALNGGKGGKHCVAAMAALLLSIISTSAVAGTPWENYHSPLKSAPESVGKYNNGCLVGGVPVPTEGPGYQVVRLERRRNYAHPETRDFLVDLGRNVERANIGLMLVADVSMPRGGRFAIGHRSHQTGLDADVWLRLNSPRLPVAKRQKMNDVAAVLMVDRKKFVVNQEWSSAQEKMVKLAAKDKRVARIFVHPAIKAALCESETSKDRDWLRTVRPWYGHDSHFHVRLHCQGEHCVAQNPPPAGDGCGKELKSWWPKPKPASKKPKRSTSKTKKKAKPKKRYVPPAAPSRCQLVLKGAFKGDASQYAGIGYNPPELIADNFDSPMAGRLDASGRSLKLLPPTEIESRRFVNPTRR